ncbi:MAG: CHAT domain-containing protein, partial [Bacteroidota bacterium]
SEKEIYYICFSSEGLHFDKIINNVSLRKEIAQLNQQITERSPSYINTAQKVYSFLKHSLFQGTTKELTIIPDGFLHYLSFDALITHKEGNSVNFLINTATINYSPSISYLLFEHAQLAGEVKDEIMIYAPQIGDPHNKSVSKEDRSKLLTILPHTNAEANLIASLYNTQPTLGIAATETDFKDHAQKVRIIHLATHALVQEENPNQSRFLLQEDSINDGYLYAYELYNMRFAAHLVGLSACNTGVGSFQDGEGVMSLARAFIYSGVRDIMTSLWSVPDRSTSEIMSVFYQNIKSGQGNAEALRNAKLEYLQTSDDITSNPYYWAGFVLVGKSEGTDGPINWATYAMISLLLFLFVFYSVKSFLKRGSRS